MSISTVVVALILVAIGLGVGYFVGTLQARAKGVGAGGELAAASAERDALRNQLADLRADRDAMSREFQRLSAEAMQRQSQAVNQTAEQRLTQTKLLMEPVSHSLQQMNERLRQVERERAEGAADLRRQVDGVRMSNENLRRETQALVTALRKPQVRGAWGETQLKRVVEIAGMIDRVDFDTQVAVNTTEGGLRPDMRVNLADNEVIFVDSKAPLGNFIDAFATDDPDRRNELLDAYVANVVTHINQLGAKNYWQLDVGSPEMVVLFLPSDALLQMALDRRPDLHEYAARHAIFLASPSILIPMLRAVQHGWKQAAFAESAQQVATLGRELYERLATMGTHLDKMGRSLGSAVKAYNETVGSLEQRVLVTARKFGELQLAEDRLDSPAPRDDSPRVLTAPELVDNAASLDSTLPKLA
jgi:DNA recombination protein RmuC